MAKLDYIHAKVEDWAKSYDGPKFHALICDAPYHLTSIVKRFGGKDSAKAKFGTDGLFQRASKGFMGQCYTPETEVLTVDGWISMKDIVENRYDGTIYSLNPNSFEIEMANIIDYQKFEYDGILYHFTGRSIDLMVTPNHKLFVGSQNNLPKWNFIRADQCPDVFRMTNQGNWKEGNSFDTIQIGPDIFPAHEFMRFLGIFIGDGSVVERKNQPWKQNFITIAAKIDRKKKNIKNVLDKLGVKYTQYNKQTMIYNKNLMEYLRSFGIGAENKCIPNHIFDYSCDLLQELLDGLLSTDGHVSEKYDFVQFFTSSKELSNSVQRLAILTGHSCTLAEHEGEDRFVCNNPNISHVQPRYVLTFLKDNKSFWFEKTDHKSGKQRLFFVPYSGYVYDITLDINHLLMVRKNGRSIWSSNSWDGGEVAFQPETWAALAEHLYPGAMGISFASARNFHRMAVAMENAGLLIHDSIFLYAYAQGFPKGTRIKDDNPEMEEIWAGHRYGLQSLKMAAEPLICFQKPYYGKPLDNITQTGAGAYNIDAGRIGSEAKSFLDKGRLASGTSLNWKNVDRKEMLYDGSKGRWPANFAIIHSSGCKIIGQEVVPGYQINRFTDGMKPFGNGAGHEFESEEMAESIVDIWECVDECPAKLLNNQSGNTKSQYIENPSAAPNGNTWGGTFQTNRGSRGYDDEGGASRFFFQAGWNYEIEEQLAGADPVMYFSKVAPSERDAGLNDLSEKEYRDEDSGHIIAAKNPHPTLKPISLTRYIASLFLPPDRYSPRRLLNPFSGVLSESIGAFLAGWDDITAIEMTDKYIPVGQRRWEFWQNLVKTYQTTDPKVLLKQYNEQSSKEKIDRKRTGRDQMPKLF